ncbi:MAG: dihydrolipoamide acetyltransferase family protein [Acidimicrobiia bacterium]
MAYEFLLPDIGEGLAEAVIVGWRVAVGDAVAMDQVVVDVETDKAVVEIPIPVAGTVLHLGGAAGDTLDVGSVLLVVGEAGEAWPSGSSDQAAPIVGTLDSEVTTLEAADRQEIPAGRQAKALPVLRKLAKDLGVDLDLVRGTGPDGRITRDDVTAAASAGSGEVAADDGSSQSGARRPMSTVRKAIAERMSRSWSEIPHVTTFDEVDATRLLEVRKALTRRTGSSMSVDALVVKAVLPALAAHPDFNARLEGDSLVDPDSFDIGVAVDTPDGLMVVVIRDAAGRSLGELAAELERLSAAAKERKATPRELSGQTFTVSNIGAVGGGYGTPIVPLGTTAILSVGKAVERPVARDGKVAIAPMMPLSLSYDHRVIDGGAGRRFLAQIVENLTEPALFLAD